MLLRALHSVSLGTAPSAHGRSAHVDHGQKKPTSKTASQTPTSNLLANANAAKQREACVPAIWSLIQVIPSVIGRSQVSLLQPATLKCSHGGVITIVNPGQQKQSANSPKKSDMNIKAETEQKLFEVDNGAVKVEGSIKSELATNPGANTSLNASNMQASMSQQLNGATLNLNSAGVPEISLANGQTLPLGNPSSRQPPMDGCSGDFSAG